VVNASTPLSSSDNSSSYVPKIHARTGCALCHIFELSGNIRRIDGIHEPLFVNLRIVQTQADEIGNDYAASYIFREDTRFTQRSSQLCDDNVASNELMACQLLRL
jgi:hypothetical protein